MLLSELAQPWEKLGVEYWICEGGLDVWIYIEVHHCILLHSIVSHAMSSGGTKLYDACTITTSKNMSVVPTWGLTHA